MPLRDRGRQREFHLEKIALFQCTTDINIQEYRSTAIRGIMGKAYCNTDNRKSSLSPDQWKAVFEEAASLGINFALLAGGEPMMRRDILEKAAEVEDMVFPKTFPEK